MKKHTGILLGIVCLLAVPLYAQQGEAPSTAAAIKRSYEQIKINITKAAEKMPESNYGFKPAPEEMSFGGWVGHVAYWNTLLCTNAMGTPKTTDAQSKTSKADLQAALKESFDTCDAAYATLTDANFNEAVGSLRGKTTRLAALAGNVSHDNECYGSMSVYLRIKGIVPPSTEAAAARGAGK